jgi:hypothetical protein
MLKQLASALFLALIAFALNTFALSPTAFTYQGQLKDAASPANGTYDLTFSLFDASTAGNQIDTTLTNAAVNVSNGLFTTTLDFGSSAFSNSVRYLEISVRTNTSSDPFITLAPRQSVTPTPTALYAAQATSLNAPLPDSQLSANIPRLNSNQTFTGTVSFNFASGNFFGSGFNLTNLNAPKLIGTAPDSVLSVNIPRLNAANNNFLGTLSAGAAIIGQNHTLTANRSGIFGGYGNILSGPGFDSAMVAGDGNSMLGSGFYYGTTLLGGYENIISDASYSTLIGGSQNVISNANSVVVLGGNQNVATNTSYSAILGGSQNSALFGANFDALIGGGGNTILSASASTILGGSGNTISDVSNAGILGGYNNLIRANGWYSSILGGNFNSINQANAIVGGYHAAATNAYTFVWADGSSSSDFTTTASHQFLIRALNGVGINTNNPSSALHVNGTITANAYKGDSSGIALFPDHLRIGALADSGSNAPGYGKALIFSGAPDTSATFNNDNSDPLWMARYNIANNVSQLRLNLGDDNDGNDRFVIGTTLTGGPDFNEAGGWAPRFSVDNTGTVRAAGTFIANTSPDLAETIPAADDVEAGDIVCADPTRREHAIRCAKGDRAILGVISDASGGFLINANGGSPTAALTGKPLVLTGRVPVKVSLENGPIKIGDTLTPSSIPGVAMRATQPGPAVGIALDAYNGSENGNEIGKVLCFVKVGDVNTATVLQQLNADTTRLEKMLTDRDARIAALEKAVTALQQAIQSK